MKRIYTLLLLLPVCLLAVSKSYNFKDPKGVNSIIFQLDALLESINGSAGGISGMFRLIRKVRATQMVLSFSMAQAYEWTILYSKNICMGKIG